MRAPRLRITFGLAVSAISAVPASAQVTPSIEVRAHASSHADVSEWQGASVLGASLRLDRPRWSMTSAGALTSDVDRWRESGSLSALVTSPALGPLQLSAASALARTYRAGVFHNEFNAQARASLRFGRRGAWAGFDARYIEESADPAGDPSPVLGAWQQLGSALLSVQLSPGRARSSERIGHDSLFNDTLGIWEYPGSRSTSVLRSWSDVEARMVWAHGRWALDGTLGGRLATSRMENSMWAQLQGLYALTPRLALIAAAGREPADPLLGSERHSFATLGLRLLGAPEPRAQLPAEVRPGAADFRVMPVRGEEYLVRVRVPRARTVELSADFTGWKPLSLTRASADWWQATVAIEPGTHHVNIRVNGDAWTAPPGTPAVEDEFNGTVGLIVLQ